MTRGTKHLSTLVDDAVQVLRQLPEDAQQAAARAIIDYASVCEQEP